MKRRLTIAFALFMTMGLTGIVSEALALCCCIARFSSFSYATIYYDTTGPNCTGSVDATYFQPMAIWHFSGGTAPLSGGDPGACNEECE